MNAKQKAHIIRIKSKFNGSRHKGEDSGDNTSRWLIVNSLLQAIIIIIASFLFPHCQHQNQQALEEAKVKQEIMKTFAISIPKEAFALKGTWKVKKYIQILNAQIERDPLLISYLREQSDHYSKALLESEGSHQIQSRTVGAFFGGNIATDAEKFAIKFSNFTKMEAEYYKNTAEDVVPSDEGIKFETELFNDLDKLLDAMALDIAQLRK